MCTLQDIVDVGRSQHALLFCLGLRLVCCGGLVNGWRVTFGIENLLVVILDSISHWVGL